MNFNTRTASRTWSVTIPVMVEGAWQMTLTYTVTAFKIGNQIISALVDGAEATLERAAHLLTWAKAEGTLTVLETVEAAQPIGKKRARQLHIELARHGYPTNHYDLASGVLGRDVASLAALTEAEARKVWYALAHSSAVAA